jgi:hypothetical protein
MREADLRPVADMLLKQFGSDAKSLAAKRAKELLDEGLQEGGMLWIEIVRAIDDTRPRRYRQSNVRSA